MAETSQIRYPYLDYARVFVAYLVIFAICCQQWI